MARFTKFGIEGMVYPAIYCFGDMRGLEAAKVDFEKHRLAALGVAIDKDIKRRITADARRATTRLAEFYGPHPLVHPTYFFGPTGRIGCTSLKGGAFS